MTRFFTCCLVIFCFYTASAQELKLKYGDLDKSNFDIIEFDGDSSVSAIILADLGFSEIQYDENRGWYLFFEKHTRIKVLSTEGYKYADIEIPLYHSGSVREDLSSFKAITYNMVDGKVKQTKTKKKQNFKEKINDYWDRIKYTLPDVKEGSIIEYVYSVKSDYFFNLHDWTFQHNVPTLWSEYRVGVPEYFNYQKIMQGYHPMVINDEGKFTETITSTSRQVGDERGLGATRGSYRTDRYNYDKTVYHWAAEKIPAFKTEPYMNSRNNYISKVEFELASTKFPNNGVKKFMGTWADINKSFLNNDDFGGRLRGSNFLKEDVEKLIAGKTTAAEKAGAIYDFVKNKVEWNGYNRRYADKSFKQIIESGQGSSADINLLLANMLIKAGIDVSPILVSTRSNGFIKEQFPLSSQFNYVIVQANLDEKQVFLDATDRSLPMHLIPLRAINQQGFKVGDKEFGWVDVSATGMFDTMVSANMALTEEGVLTGNVLTRYGGYSGRSKRSAMSKDDIQTKEEERMGWKIDSLKIDNLKDLTKPISVSYDLKTQQGVEVLGNLIYINPFIIEQTDENPFKLEKREFPVDFVAPQRFNYVYTLSIPEGFTFDEVPERASIALPNKAGILRYLVGVQGNQLTISMKMSIQQSLFTGIDYPALRQFFAMMVEKEGQQIVLKRVTE
ncbi:DUF3857 domain-containing protein [Roseivirga sp. 4D4]|uniref:DUF3857 domain-containing protein n=1 Tax=Roseivirga sp. 4D4 TaxID=1889784 RepID=UPI0009F4DAF6|nr:DUF3857 domain-containing protein [Roseivirga sp. 4D4]